MEILKWGLIAVIFVFEVALLVFSFKSRHPFRTLFLNALLGIGAIVIINLTEKYTHCHIPVNLFSVGFSSLFGLPSVAGLLLVKFLFI